MDSKDSQKKILRQSLIEKYQHKIIDGKLISEQIRKSISAKIDDLNEIQQAKFHEKPVLGYVIVGDCPESKLYVRLKKLAAD